MTQTFGDAPRRTRSDPTRVPPHNLQAEESLLGAMLLSRDAIADAVEVCDAEHFYKPAHGHIFAAIKSLYAQGAPADLVTVVEELRRADLLDAAGGEQALISLQVKTPSTANAARYATIVEEHALLRKMITAATQMADLGYSMPDDVTAALDRAESMVFEVSERRQTDTMKALRDLLGDSLDRIEALYGRGESITGVPTGFIDLDERLSGLQKSSLCIVGARPAMGKTAFALGLAANAAMEAQVPVLFFSLEMSHLELTQRLLCAEARVDSQRVRTGKLLEADWGKISHAIGRLGEAPLYIDDNPNLTVMDIRGKARRLKAAEGGLGLIVVDYLQLMTGKQNAENRQVEISDISRNLKILARELEVPVVALSQLSRNLEMRADKRPMLADLRESGCMPASTRILRADTNQEVTLGELVLTQEQPLVWSLDEHWRLVPRRLTKAFPSGRKQVFRLSLASGYQVEATANHKFRTISGWTRLDQLSVGDEIATPRCLPDATEDPDDAGSPQWLDDQLILLAHLLGDGSIGPGGVKYCTADPANADAVSETARRLFGISVTGKKVKNTWQLWLPSPYRLTHNVYHPIRNWLEPHGLWGSRSHNKFIPEEIFGLREDQLALFLRHLWATDGSITLSRNGRGPVARVYYASTSRRLAEGVRRALLRLNIRTRLYQTRKLGYRNCWHVSVQGCEELVRFLTVVGCHGERGERIEQALSVLASQSANPNVDLIPHDVRDQVVRALAESGVTHRKLAAGMDERYCGSYLLGSDSRPRRFSRRRLTRIAEITSDEKLADIAGSDIFWDRVVEVTPLGVVPTFDATVDGTHNFVANGIVAHNSLEQDADVVMFIYRDEVYNKESADKGTAEIIVAKHRNGPVGVTSLAFLDHVTRFVNMARV